MDLPTQDRQLVAQHHDLEVLGRLAAESEDEETEHLPDKDVEYRRGHGTEHPGRQLAGANQDPRSSGEPGHGLNRVLAPHTHWE